MMSLGSRTKQLFLAVFIFIALDISILAINYWITYQMSEDAVIINLSGRQRMLSQRMTKVLLQISPTNSVEQRQLLEKELTLSLKLFFTTLNGFDKGGMVTGGDGNPVKIKPLHTDKARLFIAQTQSLLEVLMADWHDYANSHQTLTQAHIDHLREQAILHNLSVLDLMNRLTFELEQDSQHRAELLRFIQTVIFLLALLNFIFIVRGMYQQTHQAIAMSEHLNTLAMHDALTGLSNRREFNDNITKQLQNYQQIDHPNRKPFALMMLDLDGFKPVNDTFGHEAGDEVLKNIAERLRSHARAEDTVARFGGDEFAIIFVGIESKEQVNKLANRLLHAINHPIHLSSHQDVRVGASIGVVLYPEHSVTQQEELVELADAAMYQAKHLGKNRVIFAEKMI